MTVIARISQPAVGTTYDYTAEVPAESVLGRPNQTEVLSKGLNETSRFVVFRQNTGPNAGVKREIGYFYLAPLPGCCGVVVSTNSFLELSWRGMAVISEHFHKIKEQTARELGYSLMLATVQLRNIPEVVGASKSGWRFDRFFRNKRTENDIGVMMKELK